jgi:hypothetical protein
MNITEIIPTEISGYCDVETGECITAETGAPHGTPTEVPSQPYEIRHPGLISRSCPWTRLRGLP